MTAPSLLEEVMQMLKTAREWHLVRTEPQTVGGVELWLIDDPERGWVDPQGRIDGRELERVARRLLFMRWAYQIDYHARGRHLMTALGILALLNALAWGGVAGGLFVLWLTGLLP